MRHAADTNGDGWVSPEEKAAWLAANPGKRFEDGWISSGQGNGFKTPWGTVGGGNNEPSQEDQDRARLRGELNKASGFADTSQAAYGQLGAEATAARDYLRKIAEGRESVSAEQLRQGAQQNVSAQRSLASSAAPGNAAMAARTAAMQGAKLGYGLAGQQAVAGLQERQSAQQALNEMLMRQRQQELDATMGSRDTSIGGVEGEVKNQKKSIWDKIFNAAEQGAELYTTLKPSGGGKGGK